MREIFGEPLLEGSVCRGVPRMRTKMVSEGEVISKGKSIAKANIEIMIRSVGGCVKYVAAFNSKVAPVYVSESL